MNILVLSDSHSSIRPMRQFVDFLHPDVIIHLGDHYDDGEILREEYHHIPVYQVPGNCDRYRWSSAEPEILILPIGGVMLYMTHGHRHQVKMHTYSLLRDARTSHAAAALYGHTHQADCHQEEDGLWVLNPGSCGYGGGSAGLIHIEQGKIINCRILRLDNVEAI